MTVEASREQVLAYRWHAHQLDRPAGIATGPTDCDLLDLGVQDSGPDGARWALQIRGTPPDGSDELAWAWAWTIRGAPHCYRRADLARVAVATAPLSDADAAKRIFDANRPLTSAGIGTLDALRTVAEAMRAIVREPTVKGEMSARLTDRLSEPYLRFCRPCNAIHVYEMPFRLAALQAGLELRPGTSPPVLERVPGGRARPYTQAGTEADPRWNVIRGYLRFFGPADPKAVAGYLDAPVAEVRRNWPDDTVDVRVDGATRSLLAADVDALLHPPVDRSVRLLGPFDPYLQLRDRDLLVDDEAHRKALWPALGRPGAVAVDGEIVGVWRPRTARKALTIEFTPWARITKVVRAGIDAQAAALAAARGVDPGGVTG